LHDFGNFYNFMQISSLTPTPVIKPSISSKISKFSRSSETKKRATLKILSRQAAREYACCHYLFRSSFHIQFSDPELKRYYPLLKP